MNNDERLATLERRLQASYAALDALKRERDLWQRRAEAMVNPNLWSTLTEDDLDWQRKTIAAAEAEANGRKRP